MEMKTRVLFLLRIAVALVLMGAGLLPADAQSRKADARLMAFMRNVQSYRRLLPQEKVYLHLDNNAYFKDETIWFSAYVVQASSLSPSSLSKVLYVELLTPGGEVVQQRKLKIENGRAAGDFDLTRLLRSGFYEIRAYTRAMLNWDEAFLFSRVIPIYTEPRKAGDYSDRQFYKAFDGRRVMSGRLPADTAKYTVRSDSFRLEFYPESGSLVYGLQSRVAYRLTDLRGKPVSRPCTLYNGKGERLLTFSPLYEGMGFFDLTETMGNAYVRIGKQTFALPSPRPTGCVMRVENHYNDGGIEVRIGKRGRLKDQVVGFCSTCRGVPTYFNQVLLGDGEVSFHIDRKDLQAGVNQLTLFSQDGDLLAQRMFFVMPSDTMQVRMEVSFDKKSYRACEPVKMYISTSDSKGRPVPSRFSLAVHDGLTELAGRDNTLPVTLLLTSDLKGYVHNPAFYFEKDDHMHRAALDNLMMVQGWTRYSWPEMSRLKFTQKQPLEDTLMVLGKVFYQGVDKPVSRCHLYFRMHTPDNRNLEFVDTIKGNGRFGFVMPDFEGEAMAYYRTTRGGKPVDYRVLQNLNFSPRPLAWSPLQTEVIPVPEPPAADTLATSFSSFTPRSTDSQSRGKVLKTAVVKGKRVSPKEAWADNGVENLGRRHADRIYDMERECERMADDGLNPAGMDINQWMYWRFPSYDWRSGKVNGKSLYKYTAAGGKADVDPLMRTRTNVFQQKDDKRLRPYVTLWKDRTPERIRMIETWEQMGLLRADNPYLKDLCVVRGLVGAYRHNLSKEEQEADTTAQAGRKSLPKELFGQDVKSFRQVVTFFKEHPDGKIPYDLALRCLNEAYAYIDRRAASDDDAVMGGLYALRSVMFAEDPKVARRFMTASQAHEISDREADSTVVSVFVSHYGDGKFFTHEKGVRMVHVKGFDGPRPFYSPSYEGVPLPATDDFRRTLYWNPDVSTNMYGGTSVEFYTNSRPAGIRFHVSARGVMPGGRLLDYER